MVIKVNQEVIRIINTCTYRAIKGKYEGKACIGMYMFMYPSMLLPSRIALNSPDVPGIPSERHPLS